MLNGTLMCVSNCAMASGWQVGQYDHTPRMGSLFAYSRASCATQLSHLNILWPSSSPGCGTLGAQVGQAPYFSNTWPRWEGIRQQTSEPCLRHNRGIIRSAERQFVHVGALR